MGGPARAWLGLGSNLGSREAHIAAAVAGLGALPNTRVLRVGAMVETEPVGGPAGQPWFLNTVCELATELTPHELLAHTQALEYARGRNRAQEVRWGPRTLDIDILLWDDLVLDCPDLVIPHPRMHERAFVLGPLVALEPDLQIPGHGSAAELLKKAAGE